MDVAKAEDNMGNTYTARPIKWLRLSAEEFLKQRKELSSTAARIRIIPPSLSDDDDYGSFLVEMKKPIYFDVDKDDAR